MRRRLIISILALAVLLFGLLRPVQGPGTSSETGTPAPVPTLDLTSAPCTDAPPTRLARGMQGLVAYPAAGEVRRNLVVRAMPGGEQVGLLGPGSRFTLTGEAFCTSDGLRWWPLENDMLSGWSVEGFAPDDYLMQPGSSSQ